MPNVASKTINAFVLSILRPEAEGWSVLGDHNARSPKGMGDASFVIRGYGESEHNAALAALENTSRFDRFSKDAKIAMMAVIDSLSREVLVEEDEDDEDECVVAKIEVW